MARILATTCWHLDNRTRGLDRGPDVLERVREMVERANEWRADLFAFLGDLMEGHSPDRRTWSLLVAVAEVLSDLEAPLLMLAGNHDAVDAVDGERALASPVSVLYWMVGEVGRRRWAAEQPDIYDLEGFTALALPHVARARTGGEDPSVYLERRAEQLLRAARPGPPVVALAHLSLPDVKFGGSEAEMRRGENIWLPLCVREDPRVAAVVCGHYHGAMEVPRAPGAEPRPGWDPVVRMPGSPERHSFGEGSAPKGFLELEV